LDGVCASEAGAELDELAGLLGAPHAASTGMAAAPAARPPSRVRREMDLELAMFAGMAVFSGMAVFPGMAVFSGMAEEPFVGWE
jgi:hypothetical protein